MSPDDIDRMPYGPHEVDEVEELATRLLGKCDKRVTETLVIDRDGNGQLTINGKPPAEIDDIDRQEIMALLGQDDAKARAEKEASDGRYLNPATNPYIKLDPE